MSGFNTKERNNNGEFEITFYTENQQDFKKVQDLCRELIGHGTPISTEGDLISRSELKKVINDFYDSHFIGVVPNELITYANAVDNAIDIAPTVEEVSVIEFKEPLPLVKAQKIVKTLSKRPQGECKTCKHRDPEDKKCDCGGIERQGCPFPVSDDYYCKYYERGSVE